MEYFCSKFLHDRTAENLVICDLGSQDINGSYKKIFSSPNWRYIGLDMTAGLNVDLVLRNPYQWKEVKSASVDVLISGQAFEHIEFFWITLLEIERVLKPGGVLCLIAPSAGPEHRYPVDCWRFYYDGMLAMSSYSKLNVIESFTQWGNENDLDGSDMWHDSFLVCKKPNRKFFHQLWRSSLVFFQHKSIMLGLQ
jgi:SAM-dependent methyltransferase